MPNKDDCWTPCETDLEMDSRRDVKLVKDRVIPTRIDIKRRILRIESAAV
jgi:hypothetical protein